MAWHLPEKRKALVRAATKGLLSDLWPINKKRQLLYSILRPALDWLKDGIVQAGVEPDEAESEIFILICRLFSSYKSEKMCLLYYIERNLPWQASRLLKELKKSEREEPCGLISTDEAYEMEEEPYLTVPNVLFEERWFFKYLSQYEKTLILRMLMEDQPSHIALANSCHVGESTMDRDLHMLAGKLKGRFF